MNLWDDDNRSVASVASMASQGSLVSLASKKSFHAAIAEYLPKRSQKSYEIGSIGVLAHEEIEGNRITNMVKRDVEKMRSIYSTALPGSVKKTSSRKKPDAMSPLQKLLENVNKLPALDLAGEQADKVPVDIIALELPQRQAKLDPMSASGKLFLPPNVAAQPVTFTPDGAIAENSQSSKAQNKSKKSIPRKPEGRLDPMSASGKLFLPPNVAAQPVTFTPDGAIAENSQSSKAQNKSKKEMPDKARDRSTASAQRGKQQPSAKVVPTSSRDSKKVLPQITVKTSKKGGREGTPSSGSAKAQGAGSKVFSPKSASARGSAKASPASAKGKTKSANAAVIREVKEPMGHIASFQSNLSSAPELAMWGSQADAFAGYGDADAGDVGAAYGMGSQFRFSAAEEGHMWGGNHLAEKPVDHKHNYCFNVNGSSDEVHIWGAHADSEAETVKIMTRRASRASEAPNRRMSEDTNSLHIWATPTDPVMLKKLKSVRTFAELPSADEPDDF
jgi:hypothetical protein